MKTFKAAFELYDRVRIKRNGVVGQIIDVTNAGTETVFTVESETKGKRPDADYPSEWPLYDCAADEITNVDLTRANMRTIISEFCNDVVFTYNNKKSGITSEVENYVPTFQAWHGPDTKEYSDVDDLMADRFFSGKALNDLIGIVEFTFL